MIYDFWSVIVVLSIISKSYSTNFDSNSYNANTTENRFLDDDLPATSLDLSFVRNSIGTISLQVGLSDGSIPVDDVIAELLNIESKDLKNLETFKTQYSELLFLKLEDFTQSGKVNDVKEALVKMFDLKELWKSVDLSRLPDEVSYKSLDDLKTMDVSGLENLKIADMQSLLKNDSLTDSEVSKLNSYLDDLLMAVSSLPALSYTPIVEKLKPLSSLGKVLNLYDDYGIIYNNGMQPENQDALKTDFEALKELKEIGGESSLDVISRFVSSRFMRHRTNITYTSGFINGFKDVETLKADRSNEWIREVVKYDLSSLESFVRLGMELINLDGHWKSVSTYSTLSSLKLISELWKLIGRLTRDSPSQNDIVTVMNELTDCPSALSIGAVSEKINKVAGNAGILLKKISAIERIQDTEEIYQFPSSTILIHGHIQRRTKDVEKELADLRIVNEGVPISEIDMMPTESANIIRFKDRFPVHIAAFDCIRDLENGFEKVASAARALMKIDQIQKNHTIMKDVQNTYEATSESAKILYIIRLVLIDIKTSMDPKLTNLTDLKNVSKPFGEAVAALVLSDAVSKRSLDFETFVNNGYSIESHVDNGGGDKFKEEFRAEWGDFPTTARDINSMFVGITNWMETIKGPNATLPLEEVGLLYENLTDFVDVDLMTLQRLNAIYRTENEQSVTIDKKLLEEFKKSLLDLSKLDLKFARFQSSVTQMPETLDLLLNILYGEVIEPFTEKPLHDRLAFLGFLLMTYPFLFGFLTMVFFSICSVRSSYRNVKKSYKNDIQRRNDKKVDADESEDDELSEFEYDYEEIMDKYEEMPESVHEDHEQITVRERAKAPESLDSETEDLSPDFLELYALYGHDKDPEEPSRPSTDEYWNIF
ncbi:Protein CBG15697 [Caenorhabditis briggsae]|uniref:Protein CBG15697 n=1 Tax=Caenorhabditis briggsae TaxID=6238 RepID=A8XMJ9_CAEBR|nr:Protein CBG15697 [Caenorhabditis briggsae]CAP33875.2 Protein CBG15697 [Caenorhabditis briggsae]